MQPGNAVSAEEVAVRALYARLLDAWNQRSAAAMAEPFAEDGEMVGYDGSQITGRAAIAAHLAPIFADHPTPAYVAKVKAVRFPAPDVAILRAIAGMVPPGQSRVEPTLNTHQTVIAVKCDGHWQVLLFQNTPAQYHGRPELVQAMTEELQQLLK